MTRAAAMPGAGTGAGRLLIQLAPPGPGGVTDYVNCLQRAWQELGVASVALALSQRDVRTASLRSRITGLLDHATRPCSLVLHFSGYGYADRGVCFWLLDELRDLRTALASRLRLIVVFHELFATSAPWRSAFWLAGVQSLIAKRLARMADELWTNTAQHSEWLYAARRDARAVHVHPVFCNVGEPTSLPVAGARLPNAIVFGSASTRQRACSALGSDTTQLKRLGVNALVEVGPGPPSRLPAVGLPHHHLGRLDPGALSSLLQTTRFGLLDYPPQLLGKSGVFAAYAAHACVVLNTSGGDGASDGLAEDEHYLSLPTLRHRQGGRAHDALHDQLAQQLGRWYTPHRLAAQSRALLALAM